MKDKLVRIDVQATGQRIRMLMEQQGLTVRDLQEQMDFQNPQAIYKWLAGKNMPGVDNLVNLSKILDVTMDDIVATDDNNEHSK